MAVFIAVATIAEALITGDALPFDCSTLEYCGLSFANTALAIIYIIVGTAIFALFAAFFGALYAIPAVFVLGSILYFRALNRRIKDHRYFAYILGALGGALWWMLLVRLDILPFASRIGERYPHDALASGPDATMLFAAGTGGMVSAEMFLRWLKTEMIEVEPDS